MQAQVVGKVGFPGTNVTETTIKVVLTPAQIRTLSSVPIDLVAPANATTFLAPGQVVFVGAQGSGAYSAPVNPALRWATSTTVALDGSSSWDGQFPGVSVLESALVGVLGANATDILSPLDLLGVRLQVISGGDVTGGDAPCTIILTYRAYDLTGLL